MDNAGRHDEAEAAVLRLLAVVDSVAGTEPADREETPENRRMRAAADLLAYFHSKHAAK